MNDLSLYYKYQPLIRTGDHIGWRSNGMIGRLIRLFTVNSINHSSMAIRLKYERLNNRRFDMAALNHGIEFHLLSKNLEKYNGQAFWYPLKSDYDDVRQDMAVKAFEILDTPYDYDSLFKEAITRVSTNASEFFCSEAWNWIAQSVGIDTGFPLSGKAPTPADIDKMDVFKDKVRIL
jgi:hypothetical protein